MKRQSNQVYHKPTRFIGRARDHIRHLFPPRTSAPNAAEDSRTIG